MISTEYKLKEGTYKTINPAKEVLVKHKLFLFSAAFKHFTWIIIVNIQSMILRQNFYKGKIGINGLLTVMWWYFFRYDG